MKPKLKKLLDSGEPVSFGHTLEDQIGGQIDAGLVITGFYEDAWQSGPDPGDGMALADFIAGFAATCSLRPAV